MTATVLLPPAAAPVAYTPATPSSLPWPELEWRAGPVAAAPVAAPLPVPAAASLPRPKLSWRRQFEELHDDATLDARQGGPQGPITLAWASGEGISLDLKTGQDRSKEHGPPLEEPPLPSSAPLWLEAAAAAGRVPLAAPVVVDQTVFVLERHEIVRREFRSGKVLQRWPLPPYTEQLVRSSSSVRFHANSQRLALLIGGPRWSEHEFVMTAALPAATLEVLQRPLIGWTQELLLGDTLVFFDGRGLVGAYDLAARLPPLASHPPLHALDVVRAESAGEPDEICERAVTLPMLSEFWFEAVTRPQDPLWSCALWQIGEAQQPRAVALLRKLVEDHHFTLSQRRSVLQYLAKDDAIETSRVLMNVAPELALEKDSETLGAIRNQLWRRGRTSEFGLCNTSDQPRHVPALELQAAGGNIGTSHPLVLDAVASDGRWSIVCEARADTNRNGATDVVAGRHGDHLGDQLEPYLVVGEGNGWHFDELIASDPNGRYVAVREGACLNLVDTHQATVVTLQNADLNDNGRVGPHRAARFDEHGTQMVYARGKAIGTELVLRQLDSGRERVIDPGPGHVWSAGFDGSGRWLEVVLAPEPPELLLHLGARRCRGWPVSFTFGGCMNCSKSTTRLIPLGRGAPIEGQDVISRFDGQALVRKPDGALALRADTGGETLIVPAACGATIVRRDSTRRLLLVACKPSGPGDLSVAANPIWAYRPQGTVQLGESHAADTDDLHEDSARFVELKDLVIDLDTLTIAADLPIDPRRVRVNPTAHWQGAEVLVERGDGWSLVRSSTSKVEGPFVPHGPLRWRAPAK